MLRQQIAGGKIPAGDLMPSVRELSREHGLAPSTVARTLKELVRNGLVVAEPRRGYRVVFPGDDSEKVGFTACVMSQRIPADRPLGARQWMLLALQKSVSAHGGAMIVLDGSVLTREQILAKLHETRAQGVVLDSYELGIADAVHRAGFPAVVFDAWMPGAVVDSVMQDGQMGGLQAVRHLASRGHRRIGWFGTMHSESHSVDRFSGVAAGVEEAGLEFPREWRIAAGPDTPLVEKAVEMLSRPNRPGAWVALWREYALAIEEAAVRLNLRMGKDIDLVGWSTEEEYAATPHDPRNAGWYPLLLWSVQTMADTICVRLIERRLNPRLPALRVKIPMRLQMEE